MADTTNATPESNTVEVRCEFCGASTKVSEGELFETRVACEDCRVDNVADDHARERAEDSGEVDAQGLQS